MGKKSKILIFCGVGILFLFSIFLALRGKNHPASPVGPVKSIPTANGTVPVNDFTKNPVAVISGTTVISDTPQFKTVYYQSDQSFAITLLATPLQQARDAAEADFLNKLQIDQSQACNLKVTLTVPYGVDPQSAGKDYGLSFCPNSASL